MKLMPTHLLVTIFCVKEKASGLFLKEYHRYFVLDFSIAKTYPKTLMECFQQGLKAAGEDGVCCGTPNAEGKYETQTYGELKTTAQRLGNAFNKLGLINGKSKIAIFSANCFEYDAIIIGGYFQNLCNVSLYDTLGEDAVKFILEQVHSALFQQRPRHLFRPKPQSASFKTRKSSI